MEHTPISFKKRFEYSIKINANLTSLIKKIVLITIPALLISATLYPFAANAQEDFSSAYKAYSEAIETSNTGEALTYAKKVMSLGALKFGEQSANTANLKYNLALAYIAENQGAPAFDVLEELKQDYRRLFGERSVEHFSVVLEQLATAQIRQFDDYKKRKRIYQSRVNYAVSLAKNIAEEEPTRSALVYYGLSKIFNLSPFNRDFFEEALNINETAEPLLLDKFGENDLRTLEIRFMLAKFLQAKNEKDDAIDYFEKVITSVNTAIDTSHPYELASHAALVTLYEGRGKSDLATEHCVAIGKMTPWSEEIDPLPLYRLNPEYPKSMARAGKGGWVELQFEISSSGFVQNIKVINSSNRGFEKTSTKALEKWRYAPKILDGKAVVSEPKRVRLDYKLG